MDSADSGSDRDRTEAKIHVHVTQLGGAAEPLVLPLAAVGLEAIASVGGKNASLGEMIRSLAASGVRMPEGFAASAAAYRLFLASNGLEPPLRAILEGLDTTDLAALHTAGQAARALLLAAPLPAARGSSRKSASLTAPQGLPLLPFAPAPPPRICPTPASLASRRPFSLSRGKRTCWRPAAAAMAPCSSTGPSPIASSTASTISR
jgi:Pyruvate phosphate dikinase, AMP/ATP-binding domain